MGSPNALSDFTLSDLGKSKQRYYTECTVFGEGVHERSLPVSHPGYQVLSDILFRLGLIANVLTQCSS